MVRGDQRGARECYSASMKQKVVDNIYLNEIDMRDEVNTRPEPLEELEPVPLDDDPEHLAYIGSKLAEDLKSLLNHFLRQNKDVFAWKQADMGGINPTVFTHKLNVSPSFMPVKQKRRSFFPERQKTINEEVGKLLKARESEKWNTLNGWPTSCSSKKQTASDDSASNSLTSTKHAQKIVSLCHESTSS